MINLFPRISCFFLPPTRPSFVNTVHYKVGGNWKEVTELHTKVGGVWKAITEGWVNVSGVWKQFFVVVTLPENMIVLFKSGSPPAGFDLMNGVAASPDMIGESGYFRGDSSEGGSFAGANTHSHGAATPSIGTSQTALSRNSFTSAPIHNSHSHGGPSHAHGSLNSEAPYRTVIPAVINGASELPTNSLFFFDGVSVPAGWAADSSFYTRAVKCGASGGSNGGASSHLHNNGVVYTGYNNSGASLTLNLSVQSPGVMRQENHRHTISHTHSGTNNWGQYVDYIPVSPVSVVTEIPAGICAWFKGSTVPDGWTLEAAITTGNKFVRCASSSGGAAGSASSHSHSHSGSVTSFTGATSYVPDPNLTRSRSPHNHGMSGGTHGAVSTVVRHYQFIFCKKD